MGCGGSDDDDVYSRNVNEKKTSLNI